jgi:hypothetical protein
MKKFILILLILVLSMTGLATTAFAQTSPNFTDYFGFGAIIEMMISQMDEAKQILTDNLGFLGAYGGYAMQSGLYAPTEVGLINFGFTTNLAFIKLPPLLVEHINELPAEAQTIANNSFLPMGYVYIGGKIPVINLKLFARLFWLPAGTIPGFEKEFILIGGGLAYTFALPIIDITVIADYHLMKGIKYANAHSYGAQAILGFNVPVIGWLLKPFIGVGYSITTISLSFNLLEIYGASEVEELRTTLYNIANESGAFTQEDVDGFIDTIGEAAQYDATINYALNFPITLGIRFKLLIVSLVLEYTTSVNFSMIGKENVEVFEILPPGAISISLGIGF